MPSSFTPSNPDPESTAPGDELVRIDKASFKGRFAKFKDRILDEFRWTLADLLEFQEWLGQEDYSYKGRKWKEVFASGAKIVGEDSTISTPLSADQPAAGLDLADIRRELKAGRLKKPGTPPSANPPKTGSR
jgi:hypothetical protein